MPVQILSSSDSTERIPFFSRSGSIRGLWVASYCCALFKVDAPLCYYEVDDSGLELDQDRPDARPPIMGGGLDLPGSPPGLDRSRHAEQLRALAERRRDRPVEVGRFPRPHAPSLVEHTFESKKQPEGPERRCPRLGHAWGMAQRTTPGTSGLSRTPRTCHLAEEMLAASRAL